MLCDALRKNTLRSNLLLYLPSATSHASNSKARNALDQGGALGVWRTPLRASLAAHWPLQGLCGKKNILADLIHSTQESVPVDDAMDQLDLLVGF